MFTLVQPADQHRQRANNIRESQEVGENRHKRDNVCFIRSGSPGLVHHANKKSWSGGRVTNFAKECKRNWRRGAGLV
jgi:hypothetical protein